VYTREREFPLGDRCIVLQSVFFALSSSLSVERMRKVGDFRVSSLTTTTTTITTTITKESTNKRNNNKNVAPRHKLESDGNNSRSVSFEGERLSSVSERCPKYVIHRSCWHLGNHRFHYMLGRSGGSPPNDDEKRNQREERRKG
jgi:hypothetical protein